MYLSVFLFHSCPFLDWNCFNSRMYIFGTDVIHVILPESIFEWHRHLLLLQTTRMTVCIASPATNSSAATKLSPTTKSLKSTKKTWKFSRSSWRKTHKWWANSNNSPSKRLTATRHNKVVCARIYLLVLPFYFSALLRLTDWRATPSFILRSADIYTRCRSGS